MGDGSPDGASGAEEEEVDVRIYLQGGTSVVRLVCIGWAHTCETIVKLTLKWRFSALMGMSVRKLPSFHL